MPRDLTMLPKYISELTREDCEKMLLVALRRMVEIDEVRFRAYDPHPEWGGPAMVYWEGSGNSLLD